MFIHITHNSNLRSIKEKGLTSGELAKDLRYKTAPDKDKVSSFYIEDNTDRETLNELRRVVYKGKVVNPTFKHYREPE